eukprot:639159-Prymnesium_polylepis.2
MVVNSIPEPGATQYKSSSTAPLGHRWVTCSKHACGVTVLPSETQKPRKVCPCLCLRESWNLRARIGTSASSAPANLQRDLPVHCPHSRKPTALLDIGGTRKEQNEPRDRATQHLAVAVDPITRPRPNPQSGRPRLIGTTDMG